MAALALCPAPSRMPSPAAEAAPGNLWLTADQICAKAKITRRTLQRYAKEPQVISRVLPERSRNGKQIREFHVGHLPQELRTKLEPRETSQRGTLLAAPQPGIGCLFPPSIEAPTVPTLLLTPQEQRRAEARYKLIEPLLTYAGDRERYASLRLSDGRAVSNSNLLAEYLSQTQTIDGKHPGTRIIWTWLKRYRTGGLPALARKPRADKGTSHFFTRFPAAGELALSVWLKPASITRAHKAILRDRELLGIPEDELPTFATVSNFLEKTPRPIARLARDGQRKWNEACAPHLTRAYTDVAANSIWVADHCIHDLLIRNDCFTGAELHKPIRVRLTCIMDLRSRRIVGYCWTLDGDCRSIATALRRAVERFGPPQKFYCDNGSDFKKLARGAKGSKPRFSRVPRESVEEGIDQLVHSGALQQLGVPVQFCRAYHPQSKHIERGFGFIHSGLDALFHSYLTGNAYNRPDAAVLAETEHRKLLKAGRGDESSLIPASFFLKLAETWIEQDYNAQHHHRGRGMDRRTPNEVFDAGYPLDQRRKADPLALATLLFERRKCLVRSTSVTLNKQRYVPASPTDEGSLYLANEREVMVAFDANDPSAEAVAYDQNGRYLAHLRPEVLALHPLERTPESRAQISGMAKLQKRLLKSTAIAIETMHQKVTLSGHRSDLQHLADRALANVPVDDLVSQKQIRRAIRPSDKSHAPASSFDIAAEIMEMLA
jgi:putative transposase